MLKWLKISTIIAVCFTSIVVVYGMGGLAGKYKPELVDRSSAIALSLLKLIPSNTSKACSDGEATACGYKDTKNKQEVSCTPFTEASPRQAIIFAFGQSNSANFGEVPYLPLNKNIVNFNPHDGKCYRGEDPLLGPEGNKGSVWTVMADKLIQNGSYDSVLITSFGIGGTDINRWTPNGDLHVRVKHTADQLVEYGITPTHVLWHQGSADVYIETSASDYKSMFKSIVISLQEYGINAPVYPAVATICGDIDSEIIRNAQIDLANEIDNVFPGANSDTLTDPIYRHDSCHFSQKGLRAHAELWVNAINNTPSDGSAK